MVRNIKLGLLGAARAAGLSNRALDSAWRRKRLLILCYHGVALQDEHEWNPWMFPPQEWFERRMERVRERCNVLPLAEALERLRAGMLPPRSVALTFDDGFYDFHAVALPVLRRLDLPATLYWFTEYSELQLPVFDSACYYLVWRGRGRRLDWPGVLGEPLELSASSAHEVRMRIVRRVRGGGLSPQAKDAVLAELAERLGVDYRAVGKSRILHLMTLEEAGEAARAGVDLQLHTHRHRVSRRRERFLKEIHDNRERIEAVSGRTADHFCYTAGFTSPEFPGWLRECGVRSATTCAAGLAKPASDPWLLPRLVDTPAISDLEFDAWLSGEAEWLPRREVSMSSERRLSQLDDEEWLGSGERN